MSGGGSLHKKDYLKIAAGVGLAATGAGAAGIGPMAGLLGASAAAAPAVDAGAGLLGMGEMAGTVAAPEGALPMSTALKAGAMKAASNPFMPKLLGGLSQYAAAGQQQPSMAPAQQPHGPQPQQAAPLPFGSTAGPYASMAPQGVPGGAIPPEVLAYLEEQRRKQQGVLA